MIHQKPGDWKRAEKKVKEAILIAESMEKILKSYFELDTELRVTIKDAYDAAPVVDEHYANSIVSSTRITYYTKLAMRKFGFAEFRDILLPVHEMKPFSEVITNACMWILKFKDYVPPSAKDAKPNQLIK